MWGGGIQAPIADLHFLPFPGCYWVVIIWSVSDIRSSHSLLFCLILSLSFSLSLSLSLSLSHSLPFHSPLPNPSSVSPTHRRLKWSGRPSWQTPTAPSAQSSRACAQSSEPHCLPPAATTAAAAVRNCDERFCHPVMRMEAAALCVVQQWVSSAASMAAAAGRGRLRRTRWVSSPPLHVVSEFYRRRRMGGRLGRCRKYAINTRVAALTTY